MVTAATATATLLHLGSQPLLAPSRTNFFTGGQSVSISNARRCAAFRKHPQCLTVYAKTGIGRIEDSEIVSIPFNLIPVPSLQLLRIFPDTPCNAKAMAGRWKWMWISMCCFRKSLKNMAGWLAVIDIYECRLLRNGVFLLFCWLVGRALAWA